MTRRSDLMCEDIFGCDHSPETPISRDGEVIEWRCRCGRRVPVPVERVEPKKPETRGEVMNATMKKNVVPNLTDAARAVVAAWLTEPQERRALVLAVDDLRRSSTRHARDPGATLRRMMDEMQASGVAKTPDDFVALLRTAGLGYETIEMLLDFAKEEALDDAVERLEAEAKGEVSP